MGCGIAGSHTQPNEDIALEGAEDAATEDVNCDDVDGPITVTGDDPHGLDGDGDGVACES